MKCAVDSNALSPLPSEGALDKIAIWQGEGSLTNKQKQHIQASQLRPVCSAKAIVGSSQQFTIGTVFKFSVQLLTGPRKPNTCHLKTKGRILSYLARQQTISNKFSLVFSVIVAQKDTITLKGNHLLEQNEQLSRVKVKL